METLQELLRHFYNESSFPAVKDLAQAAKAYAPVSRSYISMILNGERPKPAHDKLLAIARALELNRQEASRLLAAAGYQPLDDFKDESAEELPPLFTKMVAEIQAFPQSPGVTETMLEYTAEAVTLFLKSLKDRIGTDGPTRNKPMMELPLTSEEELVDDLLGQIIAGEANHLRASHFDRLTEAATDGRWEAKRRIAEALPRLVQLAPDETMILADILRRDYHPDYRADIRRRVVEAAPALYGYRPNAARALFASRHGDEVYTAMATVEALHDMNQAGLMSAADEEGYVAALKYSKVLHQQVVGFLRRLLKSVSSDPDTALAEMNAERGHAERIFRIAIQRVAPRLLPARPAEALELLAHFLRRAENNTPAEHQNLRRPVSRALPDIIEALRRNPALDESVGSMLTLLATDPDIHVRRALGDALDRLVAVNPTLARPVLDIAAQDEDPYVRQRAQRASEVVPEIGDDTG